MSATIRDIYTKAIDVVWSCKTIHQVESATKYVYLTIKRIDSEKNKSKSIKLMVSDLEYYLSLKKKAITAMNRFADQFRLPDVMHWVAMSERQPEDYKRVLWFDSRDGNVQVGYFVKETQVPYATHWMELPQPPCA